MDHPYGYSAPGFPPLEDEGPYPVDDFLPRGDVIPPGGINTMPLPGIGDPMNPDRDDFWEARGTVTPGNRSPLYQYEPSVGERLTPTIMGRETQDFADARGIGLEREDPSMAELEYDEFKSTEPPWAINQTDKLYTRFTNDFGHKQQSLLMEPIPPNAEAHGNRRDWPEGAIAPVAQHWEGDEITMNWNYLDRVDAEHVTDEYVRNKEADPDWSPQESAFWDYESRRGL